MSTISIEVNVSADQLLRALEQLPRHELDAFITHVLTLRAQRGAGALSAAESNLLLKINAAWPPRVQQRYDELVAKREQEQITPAELQELIELTETAEQRNGDYLQALVAFAELRHTTVPELMASLGLSPNAHA